MQGMNNQNDEPLFARQMVTNYRNVLKRLSKKVGTYKRRIGMMELVVLSQKVKETYFGKLHEFMCCCVLISICGSWWG